MSLKSVDDMELEELRDHVKGFRRLLNPVFMSLAYQFLGDNPVPDEAIIFSFMGGGGSDYTHVREFRRLMGDERQAMEEAQNV